MIYLKECRCFAKTNMPFFFLLPPSPRNNCFSRAFVTAASWISFCCNFTGVLSQNHERVSNANQRLCSVCTHTLQRQGRHSQDTIPRKPHPEKFLSHAVLDGQA